MRPPRQHRRILLIGASPWVDLSHFADRIDDIGISRTAAEIAAHPLGYLGVVEAGCVRSAADMARPALRHLVEHGDRRADLAGRAIAALIAVMLHERRLQRMEITALPSPSIVNNVIVLVHHRQSKATVDPPSVHQHGAGAALAMVAPLLGAGQPEMLAAADRAGTCGYRHPPHRPGR
jgi:hypothetical protein